MEATAILNSLRQADTACGSGGFLIKVLRAFWRQYQRVDEACAWVKKILRPDNGEMFLAELPPNVEAALAFRRRHAFDNRHELLKAVALRHLRSDLRGNLRVFAQTSFYCGMVRLSPAQFHYRTLVGPIRGFPPFEQICPMPGVCSTCSPKRCSSSVRPEVGCGSF